MLQTNPALEYSVLPKTFYERVPPAMFAKLNLVALNESLARDFSLDPAWLRGGDGLKFLAGAASAEPEGSVAMAYAGHQFGQWSGLLGDGRARLVGEVVDQSGARHEIHLKGAGATPYSRGGDGRATLGAAIREYIVSEGMFALGVATARSLAIVTTAETVRRNGDEPGAVLARTARSHIRVGTFQYAAAFNDQDDVKALADFAIDRLYPDAPPAGAERYRYFYRQVISRQAKLVADWMALGFIHGVMNTDNMTVSGETIDYGPCAFMDEFHPGKVFSSIDRQGRYAWNKQPEMAHWNVVRLAEMLLRLFGDDEADRNSFIQRTLIEFGSTFEREFDTAFTGKFALGRSRGERAESLPALFSTMVEGKCDFTRLFTALTRHAGGEPESIVMDEFADRTVGARFLETWRTAAGAPIDAGRLQTMKNRNPVIIPRNHQVERAIADADSGDLSTFNRLFDALRAPYVENSANADFEAAPQPEEIVRQTFCGT